MRLNIGLLGFGTVGSGVYTILHQRWEYFRNEIGVNFCLRKIAVKHPNRRRKVRVPKALLTGDPYEVIHDPEVDVVVELVGGIHDAYNFIVAALCDGKHVVTANKALLAERGAEIFELANRMKRWILFEAAVGGGIPVIKALREGLVANRFESIYSIINGTSNYILTRMSETGMDFKSALAEAQASGYAEADPRLDIEGVDAAHKLAILTSFGFGGKVKFGDIYLEGISRIRSEDIAFAREFGYRVKLLAIAKRSEGGIEARVQPTLLPKTHILANVDGPFNAVLIRGDQTGDVLLYGRGAGSLPTASSVVSDLVDIAKHDVASLSREAARMRVIEKNLKVKNISSILSRYYLRFHVVDQPGVLAKISQILGKHKISISDVIQKERNVGSVVPLILLTHHTHEGDLRKAIRVIDQLAVVRGKSQVIRIEEG